MDELLTRLDALRGGLRQTRTTMTFQQADELLDILQSLVETLVAGNDYQCAKEPKDPALPDSLEIGDIIQHANGELWMITDSAHGVVIAVRTVQVRNSAEWRLLSQARHTQG